MFDEAWKNIQNLIAATKHKPFDTFWNHIIYRTIPFYTVENNIW